MRQAAADSRRDRRECGSSSHSVTTTAVESASAAANSHNNSNAVSTVWYINLDHRDDRRVLIENELTRFGLPFQRLPATYCPEYGALGCAISHADALRRSHGNVAIFEDDFAFTATAPASSASVPAAAVVKRALEALATLGGWDVLMLAGNAMRPGESTNVSGIERVVDAQTASAYVVNQHYVRTLLHNFEQSVAALKSRGRPVPPVDPYALDIHWKALQARDRWFMMVPPLGTQRPSFSDIEKRHVAYGV